MTETIEKLQNLKQEREALINNFEEQFEKVVDLFNDTYGTTAEVVFYTDPKEKYSLLTTSANEIYTKEIVFGYQKIARKWRLTFKNEKGEVLPLTDASLSIRMSFLSVYGVLLEQMAKNIRNDNNQIRRILTEFNPTGEYQ